METFEELFICKTTNYDYGEQEEVPQDEVIETVNRWLDDFGWV